MEGVVTILGDITDDNTMLELLDKFGGKADVVLSDMAPNITGSYATVVEQPEIDGISDLAADVTAGLTIRYAAGQLLLRSALSVKTVRVDFCNLAGQSVGTQTIDLGSGFAEVPLTGLSAGCYVARVTDGRGHTTTCKFIKKQ